ncbi:MAG: hypothetical protein SVM80_02600 [Halobacteriota archaeon]|nr:hypothetical protein [Halobacteriota archaeon]
MVEDLVDIIGEGFDTWKNNLVICLPFIFNTVITSVVAAAIMGSAILISIPELISFFESAEISPGAIVQIFPEILQSTSLIITATIITMILSLLISAFFTSGAIGMAKEATKSGRADLSDMGEYGRRKYINLFFANIIITLLTFAGFIFIIPGLLNLIPILTASVNPEFVDLLPALPLLVLGILAAVAYILVISILFAPSRYAIVIDDLGAIEGLKEGFRFFMENKVEVFLLFIIVIAAMAIPAFFSSIPYIGGIISMIITLLIIQPLVVIWWSRLYLDIKKTVEANDSQNSQSDNLESVTPTP